MRRCFTTLRDSLAQQANIILLQVELADIKSITDQNFLPKLELVDSNQEGSGSLRTSQAGDDGDSFHPGAESTTQQLLRGGRLLAGGCWGEGRRQSLGGFPRAVPSQES